MRRFLLALMFVLAAAAMIGASWLAPVQAQSAGSQSNPVNLPSTHFGASDADQPLLNGPITGFTGARPANNPLAPEAKAVGQQVCTACHAKESTNFAHSTHALGMEAALARNPNTATCEACHGPGSEHAKNPSEPALIIAFTKERGTPVETQAGTCMTCHQGGPRDHWLGSVHQRNGLSCSDCHNPMTQVSAEGLTAKQSINQTCATCHNDIRQQFNRRSHMPLPEGQMACVDCHNPHGTLNASLMKTDTVNETCYQCHAEKRGPFLFEHAPVRESCLNCHTPHGSNQHALLVAPIPMLCQQCHSHMRHPNDLFTPQQLATGTGPNERVMARGCVSCHAQIHGSNSPSGPRLHR